jgi:hypothetical protein
MRELISRVLADPSFGEGSRLIRGEWQAAPSPTDIVPALERLTTQHRGAAGGA